jgi:Coenzyme PQQ synthesis protein D (PqqD)
LQFVRFERNRLRTYGESEKSSDFNLTTEGIGMTTNSMPKAKTERLIVREIDGETLVYDISRYGATCLNEFAARVWRECDGKTSVAAIAAALGEDERAVWLALHQLTKAQLLTEAVALPLT